MKHKKTRVLFLSHGGGPLPLLGDEDHLEMVGKLEMIASRIKKPSAIIVISAHWEEQTATVTATPQPSLIYDYYGFPEESYTIEYPCRGDSLLAEQVYLSLTNAGIKARLDKQRGLDHGVFVPLKIMFPEADIPCIQVSLVQGLDPCEHIQIGKALSAIQYDELLVIGSGFSFHNMQEFFAPVTADSVKMNEAFEQWLVETCSTSNLTEQERTNRFEKWYDAPWARYCHPREEHLLPLHVCYGVSQRECSDYFQLTIMNKKSSLFLWEKM